MTNTPTTTIKLSDPAEMLAAVPHLLGFHPTDSLVLITVHQPDLAAKVGLAMRVDLPAPQDRQELAEQLLTGPVHQHDADAVLLVVVGRKHAPPLLSRIRNDPVRTAVDLNDPPHRELIGTLREVFGTAGVPVVHAAWAAELSSGAKWMCYDEVGCNGAVPDSVASPLGAAMAAAGSVTFESRSDLEQIVAPDSTEDLARRAAKLDVLTEDINRERPPGGVREDLEAVFGAIRRTGTGGALTEDDLLRVLLALSDSRVRDMALGAALGDQAEAAEQLWTVLVRKAPAPEVAEAAALLAFSAYMRGDGALASVALRRIEVVRPDHRLGVMLRQAMDFGIRAGDLAVIAQDAAADAKLLIEEDGAW